MLLAHFVTIKNGSLSVLRNIEMLTSPELVSAVYRKSQEKIVEFRKAVNRPLTLSKR